MAVTEFNYQLWALRVRDRIRTWPIEDQVWWRQLLDTNGREALLIARLAVVLNAKPVEER